MSTLSAHHNRGLDGKLCRTVCQRTTSYYSARRCSTTGCVNRPTARLGRSRTETRRTGGRHAHLCSSRFTGRYCSTALPQGHRLGIANHLTSGVYCCGHGLPCAHAADARLQHHRYYWPAVNLLFWCCGGRRGHYHCCHCRCYYHYYSRQ